jgi:hypothetical protein
MIPYDDLVAALSQWRARQGLPVSVMGGGSGGTPSPGSGPNARAGSGPNAGASSSRPGMAAVHDELEVDSAAVLEDEYEGVEPTSMGDAPERPTENDMRRGGRGHDDW